MSFTTAPPVVVPTPTPTPPAVTPTPTPDPPDPGPVVSTAFISKRLNADRRGPPGDDPQFHLKLGRGSLSDVEWTAQLLQLRHRVRGPATIAALDALVTAGALAADDARTLADSYRFCERTRNRWYLVKGAAADALPAQRDQLARLARSLGTTPNDLLDEYRRVTRRARAVVERVFYGK
jgi:glutamate-ammonia-ligase adenylyltransferase